MCTLILYQDLKINDRFNIRIETRSLSSDFDMCMHTDNFKVLYFFGVPLHRHERVIRCRKRVDLSSKKKCGYKENKSLILIIDGKIHIRRYFNMRHEDFKVFFS